MPHTMDAESVMPSKFSRFTTIFVQQGSSHTLRVSNQNKFYVIRREVRGSQILDETIVASFDDENKANEYAAGIREE